MIKKVRYFVGYFGFLSLFLLVTLAAFGQFSVSEAKQLNETTGTCVSFIYVFFLFASLVLNLDLVSDNPVSNMKTEAWSLIAYVLFLVAEYLVTGSPTRGFFHTILPIFALPIPAIVSIANKWK